MKKLFFILFIQILIVQFSLPNYCSAEDTTYPVLTQYKDLLFRYDQLDGGAELAASLILQDLEEKLKALGLTETNLSKIKEEVSIAVERAINNQGALNAAALLDLDNSEKLRSHIQMAQSFFGSFSKILGNASVNDVKIFLEELLNIFPEFHQAFYKVIPSQNMIEKNKIEVKTVFAILASFFTDGPIQYDFLRTIMFIGSKVKAPNEELLLSIDPNLIKAHNFNNLKFDIKKNIGVITLCGIAIVSILTFTQGVVINGYVKNGAQFNWMFFYILQVSLIISGASIFVYQKALRNPIYNYLKVKKCMLSLNSLKNH